MIRSTPHQLHYLRPFSLGCFFNLLCVAFWRYEEGVIFNLCLNLVIVGLTAVIALRRVRLLVDDQQLVLWRRFPYERKVYSLRDLCDMAWSGKPVLLRSRYGKAGTISNDQFELTFKNGESLLFQQDDYGNFAEIRKFFYNYCTGLGIIHVRPLAERKRSRLRSRRRLT